MNNILPLELPEQLYTAVQKEADETGVSPTQWLQDYLQKHLFQPPNQPAEEKERIRQLAEGLSAFDLPIGVYVVTRDGQFIKCHKRVREILRLAQDEEENHYIHQFYRTPEHREILKQRLEEQEREVGRQQWVEKEILEFEVEGREIFIQDHTRSIYDPYTQEAIGYICCMVDVTEEENYRRLFERLPIGVYRLDEKNRIVWVNKAWYEMLGYGTAEEVKGRLANEFYAEPEEVDKFEDDINQKDAVIDNRQTLQKKNGEHIHVSVSAFKDKSPDGEYAGRAGTMMDVTTEERYRSILDGVPVGLYVARTQNGEDLIKDFNKHFLDLLEFDNQNAAMDFKVKDLHATEDEYRKFRIAIESSPNHALNGYTLKVKTLKNAFRTFEINSRLLHNSRHEIVGRVGAIRDITEEDDLRKKKEELVEEVKELTHDIGAVLHAYSSALVMIKQSVEAVISSLKPDPFDKTHELQIEEAIAALTKPARLLTDLVDELLQLARSGDRAKALPGSEWSDLENLRRIFRNYASIAPFPESYPSLLCEASVKLISVCEVIQKGKLPREKVREVRSAALDMLQICNLIVLHQVSDVTIEMDYVTRALREYLVTGSQTEIAKTEVKVQQLISQAISRLRGFAKSRRVEFDVKEIPDIRLPAIEHDVLRAIANLLHNAIKYSWVRKKDEAPWISIRVYADAKFVHIEFENWGVPIPKEEIEKGLIYKLGYRGRKSGDRGRAGTGVGLTDARRVVLKHGGSLSVKSHPARSTGKPDDYQQPFITTATISLPLYSKAQNKEQNEEKA